MRNTLSPISSIHQNGQDSQKEREMKYAVFTAKHHDGFCLFDSKTTDFKSTVRLAGKDFVKEYLEASKRRHQSWSILFIARLASSRLSAF